jgi:CubicO group peptidase (beta-lactamase class C family)
MHLAKISKIWTDMIEVNGYCSDQFDPLRSAFLDNFTKGREIGASLALFHKGEMVLDIWGGYRDRASKIPWEEDTIVNVFSTGKIVAITCVLMLIDRGLMSLDAKVADYWPEFAQGGKEKVTIRHALTHRALVPGMRTPISHEDAQNWELYTAAIAAEEAWFETGTLCYHPYAYGVILGELVRRVSGMDIDEFCRSELTEPLDADFQFRLRDKSEQDRTALLTFTGIANLEEGTFKSDVMMSVKKAPPGVDVWQSWAQQHAILPGSNGLTNARGLARIAGMLAMGGTLDGKRYLSQDIMDEARTEQVHEECLLLGELRLGLGFGLDSPGFRAPTSNSYHWGGYGGSVCVIDPVNQVGLAYAMNRCITDEQVKEDGSFEMIDSRLEGFWEVYKNVVGAD